MATHKAAQKKVRFDYEAMRAAATSDNRAIRKRSFVEYFERFNEFPSYLFDNEEKVDEKLRATIDDLLASAECTKDMRAGIDALLRRLPY